MKSSKELMTEEFVKLYDKVFDEQGNVRTCGREACKDLIRFCQSYADGSSNICFGNEKTGFMKVQEIKHLKEQLVG